MNKPTKAQLTVWRAARVQSYADRLSVTALASMVVELEDDHGCTPEFEIDDEWPDGVRHLRAK